MSEPARQIPPSESGYRSASGSLRDWLAAMRAQSHETAQVQPEPRAARAEPQWSPRLVEPKPNPAPAQQAGSEDPDISDLMAENLMLNAKLKVEGERQEALQEILAQEIRSLRGHVQQEIEALQAFRSEREAIRAECEAMRAECARLTEERDATRAERETTQAECEELRAECARLREEGELWRARAEALAQPLFQAKR